jgi:hypothetical protein
MYLMMSFMIDTLYLMLRERLNKEGEIGWTCSDRGGGGREANTKI